MDFHSLCQKIDVDNIRAKFPPLPAMPALPQIKLPKSMPKIKSRKIFRSSRENINRKDSQKQAQHGQQTLGSQSQLAYPPIPPSTFIKQTPTRISTISSLVHQDSTDGSTYRSADSIDDVLPLSRRYSCATDMQVAMSPLRGGAATTLANDATATGATTANTKVRLSFTEKLHRSYKDLSEFRIKNIFGKKTIVRKDDIRVEQYVEHYKEDLVRETKEQERRDQTIAENYTFRFKLSRQNTNHSNSVTPDDSPRSETIVGRSIARTVGEHSGDESGMEATPPPRKPGIASTRFARVRSPPLRQSSSEREAELNEEQFKRPQPIPSSLWSTKMNRTQVSADQDFESENETEQKPSKTTTTKTKFSYKERVRRLASYISTDTEVTPSADAADRGSAKMLNRLKSLGKRNEKQETVSKAKSKRKTESSPLSTDEEQSPKTQAKASPTAGKTFGAIKNNFKRLQQSITTRQHSTQASTDDEATTTTKGDSPKTTKTQSKTEKLTSRLRRFRSRDVSSLDLDDEEDAINKPAPPTAQSPIRQAISNQLQNWKKSFKKKTNDKEEAHTSEAETSPEKDKPEKQKRSDTLIKKLKHIRSRKQTTGSNDELDNAANTDTDGGDETSKPKTSKFTEARQRTFKKVNEKMQQIKFFHKSQELSDTKQTATKENKYHSEEEDWDESPGHEHEKKQKAEESKARVNLPPAITRRDFPAHQEYNSEPEDDESLPNVHRTISIPAARAAWTSRPPFLSESMDSDADASEFPRVLIHQDNSDCFESTLIIAVTRSPSTISSSRITEINTEEKSKEFEAQVQKSPNPEKPKQTEWIPNKNIIADFLEATPPVCRRKKAIEINAPPAIRRRRKSTDSNSNSDSDSRDPECKRKNISSRRSSRGSQQGLFSIDECNEAWKVKPKVNDDQTTLYKSKSIDIFEKNILKGGALTAFEDFDDALKNEPVLKIAVTRSVDSYEREGSEDTADDDNSSRITKISVNTLREGSTDSITTTVKETTKETAIVRQRKTLPQYANSRESLIANFDENEENDDSRAEEEDDEDDEDDRPPSAAPSPPPKMSPPPPPLPQRQPSMRSTKNNSNNSNDSMLPPPLPKSKPPLPPVVVNRAMAPPRIPERTASMPRAPKPLVKTSSLRLVFSEQVKPADIGKVNKLISRFEPTTEGQTTQRPRVISRRIPQDDSEEYSDDEEDFATMADKLKERYANIKIERDTTPTPTNTPGKSTPEAIKIPDKIINRLGNDAIETPIRIRRDVIPPMIVTTTDEDNNTQILTQHVVEIQRPLLDLPLDNNSNCSRPNSEYGSPLEYPSSLRSSMETIPTLEKKDMVENQRLRSVDRQFVRSRRSTPRDNENYYSFDSDEENSYYSISSTSSNPYVVEL